MNPLRATYDAYSALQAAGSVTLLCSDGVSLSIFNGTSLDGMSPADIKEELQNAERELDDLAILALYAAFEAELRDHLQRQADILPAAMGLSPGFQTGLFQSVVGWSTRLRLDEARKLYHPMVGDDSASRIGQIERYRHWVAHGRRGKQPASFDPADVFADLTQFLQSAKVI